MRRAAVPVATAAPPNDPMNAIRPPSATPCGCRVWRGGNRLTLLVAVPKTEASLFVASACTGEMPGIQQQRRQLQQTAPADDRIDPAGAERGDDDEEEHPPGELLQSEHGADIHSAMIPESRPRAGIRSARWQTGRMLDALTTAPLLRIAHRDGAVLRRAVVDDADAVIALLADDPISAARGDVASDEDRPVYAQALTEILAEPSNDLLVVELDGAVVGTLQLTSIPGCPAVVHGGCWSRRYGCTAGCGRRAIGFRGDALGG